MLSGVLITALMSVVLEQGEWDSIHRMTVDTWLAIGYLVVFGSLVGFTAYSWLVNNAPPQISATYAYVNPVVALILGWVFLKETLAPHAMAGSAIVIAGWS